MKSNKLRVIIPLVVALLIAIGYVANLTFGTLSAVGWSTISLLCPLGALTTTLATHSLIPRVAIALVLGILVLIVFGRAFCAWVCPVPVLQRLRGLFSHAPEDGNKEKDVLASRVEVGIEAADENGGCSRSSKCSGCAEKRGSVVDSRHIILGGSLLTALVFGFPVFCLICPIGLTFASIFLVINLFTAGDLTWAVIFVPFLLAVEVVFFRKWCSRICPLSAFMSLLGKVGRFFRPRIEDAKCLETSAGKQCGICGDVCPERIDPRHPDVSHANISECTKCRVCIESCPAKAITMPIYAGKSDTKKNPPSLSK